MPDLSVDEIEVEIDKLYEETNFIERWIIRRANDKLDAWQVKDQMIRGAYTSGYRRGFEHSAWFVTISYAIAITIAMLA